MHITFYTNSSDDKTVPKTLTQVSTITGYSRENLDMQNPVLLITSNTPITANYMYIQEFSRYYFCRIEIVKSGLYRAHGKVDVLQSFWNEIKNAPCIINRSKNQYNGFIDDPERKFYQYTQPQYINIGSDIGKPDTTILVTVG